MESLRTLTIVKTDIRGFTDRVATMRVGELDRFLAEHRDQVQHAMVQHGGRVIKNLGDSYLVTFESSTAALKACIQLQRDLAGAPGTETEAIEVRIAVTAGDVLLQDGDIFGTPVNTVARLEGETPAGEIYFTEAVRLNLNPNEIVHEPMGTYRFKGVPDPVDVYRTTFRHQTRMISEAWVFFSDIRRFADFAENAPIDEVEGVLLASEVAHREAIAQHGGVLQNVLGDGFLATFESLEAVLGAFSAVCAQLQAFNDRPEATFNICLGAGVDCGDIRVFRLSTYGDAISRASRMCCLGGQTGTTSIAVRQALSESLSPESLQALGLTMRALDPAVLEGYCAHYRQLPEWLEAADVVEILPAGPTVT
ncbi:MAG: adenylate/guanylate cyclase domain-containing protein [Myxococcota bacterium]|jgi:class 3 adenylate cyclase|nr:adenylate/guanylate cyclase domain-containing protein [Myxococcota bacterium]